MSQKHLVTLTIIGSCLLAMLLVKLQPTPAQIVDNQPTALIFFGKNAYEEPVWEELLEQDIIHFQDVDDAFHAYYDDENHELSHDQHEAWEKIERAAKRQLDGKGNFYSKDKQYQDLLKYREAKRNLNAPFAQNNFTDPTTYTFGTPNAGNAGRWKNIGPFGDPEVRWSATGNGALDMVKFHPTNPAVMYVAARNRGLWRTENYGKNWTPLTDYFASPHIRSVEVCPSNGDIIYLGGIDKMWKSTDAANSWTEIFNVSSANVIQEIHADPTDPNRVIVTTEGGVYLSTDGGQNWTEKFDGVYVHLDISEDWTLMITENNDNGIAPTLSFSLDKGDTWQSHTITNEYATVDKFYFAITETTPKQVYAQAIINSNTPTRFAGLWKSDFDPAPADGSTYFTGFNRIQHPTYAYPDGPVPLRLADNADGYVEDTDHYGSVNLGSSATWIGDFWVSPNDPNRLMNFKEKIWSSEDGGILWEFAPSYGGSNWADNRFVTMNIAKDTVYWCNDGGIWCIAEVDLFPTEAIVTASGLDKGAYRRSKVVHKNGDICVIEGSQMDVSQMNKDVVMTGGQDIGQIFSRDGKDAHIASADVYRGRMKPNRDSVFITGALNISIDGGSDEYQMYNNINADHFNPDRLYGFTRKNNTSGDNISILARSKPNVDAWLRNSPRHEGQANTGGGNITTTHNDWDTFTATIGKTEFSAATFEQSRANAEIAFLGDESTNKLYITNDLSTTQPTWTELTNAPPASRYRIATHQFNENIIVLATEGGVYISKDKGGIWAKRGTIPEGSPTYVLLDKNRTEGIYVMTSMTVYYIDETLTDWIEFNQGQPLHQNVDMRIAYYANNDNRLYVGKYGSGVWGSPLYSVLADNNDMPVVDFRIHGNSENVINSGEEVQLIDLSMNYTSLSWTVENGGEVHNAGNEKYPIFTLTATGFYKVTLTATNANGSISEVKEHYIEVVAPPSPLACTPESVGQMTWTKRIRYIDLNGERYTNDSYDYYVATNKTFEIGTGQSSIFLEQRSSSEPKYQRAWIDYNNDGDFDNATEEIANSGGIVNNSTSNFTPPTTAPLNALLKMRVVVIDSGTAPTNCENTGDRQTVDFFIEIKSPAPMLTNSHTIQSVNSATVSSTYTNGMNVLESGVLYSTFDGNLNFNNATKVAKTGALTAAENFDTPLTNLEYNVTYYYQTYVLDDSGLHYSEKKDFILAPYKILTAESIHATNLGGTEWELKGFVYPEGNNVTSITLEHGGNDFSNTINIDISSLNPANTFNISQLVDIGAATSYQFRIKVVDNRKTSYSNIYTFLPNQTYCTTSISSYTWYKRYIGMSYGSFVHESTDGNDSRYEDVTANKVGAFEMGNNYTLVMKGQQGDGGWNYLSYIAYIDLNNDQDFDDYNEVVGSVSANGLQLSDLIITIPTQDVITQQDLRMRIVGHEGGTVTSCYSSVGNYKDFTVSIKAGNCTGTGHFVTYYKDADGDTFGNPDSVLLQNCSVSLPTGYVTNNTDCNDNNAAANPNSLTACVDDFPGMALDVRGNEGSVTIPNNALFQFGTSTDFSVALWMRTTNWLNDASLISTKDWDSGRNKGWNIALGTNATGIDVNVGDGTNRADLLAGNINDGEWHHVAATFDRDGSVSLYLDGTLAQSTSMSNVEDISNTLNLTIGADSEDDYPFDGLIDEVSLWNKVLTLAEIREQKHITLTGNNANLVAYYQFNKPTINEYISSLKGDMVNSATLATATEPVGGGFANTQTESTGFVTFTSTDFTSNFTSQNGATVVASKINLAPNLKPATLLGAFDQQYWVIDRYGTGAFSGNITFKFEEDLNTAHENTPADIQLFGRAINSDDAWQLITTATSVDATNNTATFEAITEFTQFLIGTNTANTTCTLYVDADGDGYGDPNQPSTEGDCANIPIGFANNNTDFDDTERTRYPNAMEICDNVDNDNNGEVDEGADYDSESMMFTNETLPSETYTARTTIETNQTVNVMPNTDVHLIAGQTITFKEGFSVAAGAEFHAQIIDDCAAPFTDTEILATARTSTTLAQTIGTQLTMQVSPNPFRNQTLINFDLPTSSKVSLLVYGMNGQIVETIVKEVLYQKGSSSINFSAKTPMNGMYYFVLKTDTQVRTEKVVVLP